MDTKYKIIGQRLAKIRKELNFTQEAAGNLIGASKSYVSSIEAGKKPSLEYIIKLATEANASYDWIFTGKTTTQSKPITQLEELAELFEDVPKEAHPYIIGTIKTIIQNSKNPKDTASSTLTNGNDDIKSNIA